ncbi:protein of unknown function DUF106 transmembrane [Methanothermus fervidus DSM 2088]|uniref:DUF106 domain-containing protein n=1 Tax=Methanothermus fervidus (strain ATCC 43054 / DSM 2088 / JCM 10308 / V24 S) TaxID=523846 RepID=E3GZE4_METFV|nr:EMC3/TMCO1 family protein [Methanothermus fervidus]ADP77676.1 protein of unknown function DUF106 transmembrane [Methanothermus fervidus DSM 2088]
MTIFLNPVALDPNPNNPLFTIFLISIFVAFISTLASKILIDHEKLEKHKKEIEKFQKELKKISSSSDPEAMRKLQEKQIEFFDKQKEIMIMSFKPLLVTFIPILLVFYWMARDPHISKTVVILPKVAYYLLLVPLWHMLYPPHHPLPPYSIGWLGWYILCTLTLSQIFRKLMGVKA